eukprot:2295472-Rhodomonas_salina.2
MPHTTSAPPHTAPALPILINLFLIRIRTLILLLIILTPPPWLRANLASRTEEPCRTRRASRTRCSRWAVSARADRTRRWLRAPSLAVCSDRAKRVRDGAFWAVLARLCRTVGEPRRSSSTQLARGARDPGGARGPRRAVGAWARRQTTYPRNVTAMHAQCHAQCDRHHAQCRRNPLNVTSSTTKHARRHSLCVRLQACSVHRRMRLTDPGRTCTAACPATPHTFSAF